MPRVSSHYHTVVLMRALDKITVAFCRQSNTSKPAAAARVSAPAYEEEVPCDILGSMMWH